MKRWLAIGATLVIITMATLVVFQLIQSNTQKNIQQVTDSDIAKKIQETLPLANTLYHVDKITVKKKELYLDKWLIVDATLDDEPAESEAREMVYVFESNSGNLYLLAYSGDGFTSDSFPSSAPDSLVERANQP